MAFEGLGKMLGAYAPPWAQGPPGTATEMLARQQQQAANDQIRAQMESVRNIHQTFTTPGWAIATANGGGSLSREVLYDWWNHATGETPPRALSAGPKPEPVPLGKLIENLESSDQSRIEMFL